MLFFISFQFGPKRDFLQTLRIKSKKIKRVKSARSITVTPTPPFAEDLAAAGPSTFARPSWMPQRATPLLSTLLQQSQTA